ELEAASSPKDEIEEQHAETDEVESNAQAERFADIWEKFVVNTKHIAILTYNLPDDKLLQLVKSNLLRNTPEEEYEEKLPTFLEEAKNERARAQDYLKRLKHEGLRRYQTLKRSWPEMINSIMQPDQNIDIFKNVEFRLPNDSLNQSFEVAWNKGVHDFFPMQEDLSPEEITQRELKIEATKKFSLLWL
ncbi:MAG: hypothetical protein M3Q80_02710, partial [bacterium]|nr:hypothetical protein [bacterium]